jgi:Tfp pilus assembly protein PilV
MKTNFCKKFGKTIIPKSEAGFTLFTALIAFILIILALLLVQSMVSTQRSTLEIISDISEQKEMQSIADLARSDALQVVNYGIRFDIESYSTKDEDKDGLPDNTYFMNIDTAKDWECVKIDFMRTWFGIGNDAACGGSTQNKQVFASLVANHLENLLETTSDTRGYSINIAKPEATTMSSLLDKALENNFEKRKEEVFEVIDCTPENYKECNGSFYVVLDMSPDIVPDSEYEKFPQVRIENLQTGRVLKEPIMSRGKNRIYIPVRLFKALNWARVIGFSEGGLFSTDFTPPTKSKNKTQLETDVKSYTKTRTEEIINRLGMNNSSEDFYLSDIEVIPSINVDTKGNSDPDDDEATLIAITLNLYFQENNPKYQVSKENKPHKYGIKLYWIF